MDKMKETVKPSMDRTRRQLIIGAGLTPLVVTLHSAKVFGQDLAAGSPSGAAPFSGVIEGSLGPDGQTPGNASTEVELYNLIASGNCPEEVYNYYGQAGHSTGDFASYSVDWEYGNHGTMGEGTPYAWTYEYEKPFVDSVMEYQKACRLVANATTALTGNSLDNVPMPTDADIANASLMPLPQGTQDVGCFELVQDAAESLDLQALASNFNAAATSYNEAHQARTDDGFVPVQLLNLANFT